MTTQIAIAEVAAELADPHQHREPRWGWDRSRHRIRLPDHVTVQPGLVTQLREAIAPVLGSAAGGARGIPRSAPPLQLEALSRYRDIDAHTADWCRALGVNTATRPDVEARIRALAGANHFDRAADLYADLRRWRSWAATCTGWQAVYIPRAPCPVSECARMSSLRINLDRQTAVCTACRSWWDEQTITILAAHISDTTDGHQTIRVRSGRAGHGGWASRATHLTQGATP